MNEQTLVELLAGPTPRRVVERIRAVLWQERAGTWNADKEWSADTLDAIASILINAGFGPDGDDHA